jgi:hypothetical protein
MITINIYVTKERKKKLIKGPEGLGFQQKVLHIRLTNPLKVIFNRMALPNSMWKCSRKLIPPTHIVELCLFLSLLRSPLKSSFIVWRRASRWCWRQKTELERTSRRICQSWKKKIFCKYTCFQEQLYIKGIFQPFELGDETSLIRSDVKK